MLDITVIEPFAHIAAKLAEHIAPNAANITSLPNLSLSSRPDLLLFSQQEVSPFPGVIHCKILLAPGQIAPEVLANIQADWIVSFGLSARDTITFSSLEETRAQLAVLREIVTLRENLIEPQEIPVTLTRAFTPEQSLAFYGALLLLDKPLH